jgi:ArsR family transcriptional regulator, arsenate/arsenite/antimonite-responsive transcriptional repressor
VTKAVQVGDRIEICQSETVNPEPCCPPLLDGPLDEAEAIELAAVLKALADPARVRLVSMVACSPTGEICACDLPLALDRAQPTVSHHLSQLVKAGIFDREQRGKWAWFRLRRERLASLRVALGEGPTQAERS